MGVFDELSRILKPHSDRLNENLATQGNLIHKRLSLIEQHLVDIDRPTTWDKWYRLSLNFKAANENPIEIGPGGSELRVPINEQWILMSVCWHGTGNVFRDLNVNGDTVVVGTTLTIFPKGAVVFLPGDHIQMVTEVGTTEGSIGIIRNKIPQVPRAAQSGPSSERLEPTNTHDPQRDVIESRAGQYIELPGEVTRGMGEPSLVSPTVPFIDPTTV